MKFEEFLIDEGKLNIRNVINSEIRNLTSSIQKLSSKLDMAINSDENSGEFASMKNMMKKILLDVEKINRINSRAWVNCINVENSKDFYKPNLKGF